MFACVCVCVPEAPPAGAVTSDQRKVEIYFSTCVTRATESHGSNDKGEKKRNTHTHTHTHTELREALMRFNAEDVKP